MIHSRQHLLVRFVLILHISAVFLWPAHAAQAVSPIAINEFLPSSSLGPEWTEITNMGDAEVDLSNWKIDDDTIGGTRTTIPNGTRIPGHSLLVIANASTFFNDTGADAVQLSDAAGNLIDSAIYSGATKEMSYARIPDGSGAFVKGTPSQGSWNVAAPTNTPTNTPTVTPANTSTPTAEPSATPTNTLTATPTNTAVPTETATATPTNTATPTDTPSATNTVVPTDTPSATNTVVPTDAPSATDTVVPTDAPSATDTVVPTDAPSATATDTATPTNTATPSAAPTHTPSPTATDTATPTNTATPSAAPTHTPSPTATDTATPTNTATPSQTPANTPSATSTPTITATPTKTPTNTATATSTATPYPAGIIISEFLANPKIVYSHEWIELYNSSNTDADLSGWKLDDAEGGSVPVVIAAGTTIAAHGYLVVNLSSPILNNDGDSVRLLRPNGTVADATAYTGSQVDISISRATDGSWYTSNPNTPGEPNALPVTPTLTPTATLTPSVEPIDNNEATTPSPTLTTTATASPTAIPENIQINEFLPYPRQHYSAEWIELYNRAEVTASLAGWKLDDGEGGAAPFTLPSNTIISAHGYLLITLPSSLLNNSGDSVRLLRPDDSLADEVVYTDSQGDLSYSRAANGDWYLSSANTPGEVNAPPAQATVPPSPTPSSTPTPTRTPSPTRTATATRTPSPTHTATAMPSATASPTPAIWPDGILLSEALANPRTAYDAEWVELYNSSAEPADLSGWKIDDGEGGGAPYSLPGGTSILPGEYLLITLPNALLNNSGDTLRLLRPDGSVADLVALPSAPADTSYSRAADGSWHISNTPSPATPNSAAASSAETAVPDAQPETQAAATAAPPQTQTADNSYDIVLNEALPDPRARYTNEWVELANRGDAPAVIGGWALDDGPGGGAPFKLPAGTQIAAHDLFVVQLPKALLNNGGDTVRLLRPDGSTADEHRFGAAKPDMSICRAGGAWQAQCEPSPGHPNRSPSLPASTAPASIAAPGDAGITNSPLPGQASPASNASLYTSAANAGVPRPSNARVPAQLMNHPAAQPYALSAKGQRYTGQPTPTAALVPTPRIRPTANPQPAPVAPALPALPIGVAILVLGAGGYAWSSRRSIGEHNQPPDDTPADE